VKRGAYIDTVRIGKSDKSNKKKEGKGNVILDFINQSSWKGGTNGMQKQLRQRREEVKGYGGGRNGYNHIQNII
jgi:hypothetical protein